MNKALWLCPFKLLAVLWLTLLPTAAWSAVELSFYSKEFGTSFPHAFVRVQGTVDSSGEVVDQNYGFTAKTVSPAVLLGSVSGEIVHSPPSYVANSNRHFSFTLKDDEYAIVLATVEKWREFKQPSYNLNRRNCVFFVADVASALGLKADTPPALMKKPKAYLESLQRANQARLEKQGAVFGGS